MPGWSSRMIRALDTQVREVPRSNRGSGHMLRSLIILSVQFLVERSNLLIEAFQRGAITKRSRLALSKSLIEVVIDKAFVCIELRCRSYYIQCGMGDVYGAY